MPSVTPDSPLNPEKFTFSSGVAEESKQNLDKQIAALENRVEKILDRAVIKDVPVLRHIVAFTTDQDDLRVLGKACQRIADLLPDLEDLKEKRNLVNVSIENPEWVYSVFADMSREVETVESFLDKE